VQWRRGRIALVPRYWLMKSEPDVYGFRELWNAPNRTGGWEGVRNYQARNSMMEMRVGDGVLFYHSSTNPAGVAGLARVVREAYPDTAQFDPTSDYFDAKSQPDNPRWYQVDIQAVQALNFVTLETLRADASLEGMLILRRGNRLSVTPVEEAHYRRVLELGGVTLAKQSKSAFRAKEKTA
jgi:predicted RNA-binding protein with PUA-like domain